MASVPSQVYAQPAGRIGVAKAQILKNAKPVMVLGISGERHTMQAKNSDTVRYQRWLPQGGSTDGSGRTLAFNINHWDVTPERARLTEGVTPNPGHLKPQRIDVRIKQYGVLFSYTDFAEKLNEENFRKPMRKQAGQSAGLILEKIHYAALRGGINKSWAGGSSVTNRQSVKATFSLADLLSASMNLQTNKAEFLKSPMRDPRAGNDIAQVEGAYCVFCHTRLEATIRSIQGFLRKEQYAGQGRMMPMHALEIGAINNFRFILSPELEPYMGAGASVTTEKVFATSGKADVFPILIIGRSAWAMLSLGKETMPMVKEVTPSTPSKSDALNQLGFISVKFYAASFIQNEGWMFVIESAATDPAK